MELHPKTTLQDVEYDSGSLKAFVGKCGNTYLALVQASEKSDRGNSYRHLLAPYAESTDYETIREIVYQLNYGNVEDCDGI